MRGLAPLLVAALLSLVGSPTFGADLVVWWQTGFYPGEDEVVREMVTAFEAKTVDDEELGPRQQADLIRARLEDVLVRIAPDEAGHRDVVAADLVHDVLKNAERHNDPQRGFGC